MEIVHHKTLNLQLIGERSAEGSRTTSLGSPAFFGEGDMELELEDVGSGSLDSAGVAFLDFGGALGALPYLYQLARAMEEEVLGLPKSPDLRKGAVGGPLAEQGPSRTGWPVLIAPSPRVLVLWQLTPQCRASLRLGLLELAPQEVP